jgi:predicted transcriptional regulator
MRFRRRARQQRVVLDALAAVGDSGMTPLALAVTTQLPEPRLDAILQELIEDGAVVERRVEEPPTAARVATLRYHLTLPRQRV